LPSRYHCFRHIFDTCGVAVSSAAPLSSSTWEDVRMNGKSADVVDGDLTCSRMQIQIHESMCIDQVKPQ
jgi:hypothetical protein